MFDDVNEAVEAYVDLLAERVVQPAGVAQGTLGAVISGTALPPTRRAAPTPRSTYEALAAALATFGSGARRGIDEMTESGDAASADILTEVVRGIDRWLWFVEAHLPERAAPASA